MRSFVLVEHNNQHMNPSTAQVLTAALSINEKPTMVVIGYQCASVAEQVATLAGVGEVWLIDAEEYCHFLAESIAKLLVTFSSEFDVLFAASSTFGKNILPRVAAMLDVAQVSDVTRLIDVNTVEHPIYAGNAIQTVRCLDKIKIFTIRTTAFDAVTAQQAPVAIKNISTAISATHTRFIEHQLNASSRPELSSAKIVVSGGRGLQSAEQFKLVDELADVLGAAVGASRAAVDAGFVPNDYQVGQTGKVVAPLLYIAIGISGAIQHIAGMKDSKVIVAINKDEDAPIFQIADYGLVGDLFSLVPELIEQLKQE